MLRKLLKLFPVCSPCLYPLASTSPWTTTRTSRNRQGCPSTLKRNSLRKKLFLKKKAEEQQAGTLAIVSPNQSKEVIFKCDHCEAKLKDKNALDKHIDENYTKKLIFNECDFTTTTFHCMNDHNKLEHIIEQLDGSTEDPKNKEHNDLWCYKC